MVDILRQREPVLLLAGYLVTTGVGDEPVKTELRFSDHAAVDVPTELHDFLAFMKVPRLQSEASRWLDENGGNSASIRHLLLKGWLVAVLPGPVRRALSYFKGIRIVPTCYVQKESERFDDFHYVTNAEHAPFIERVSPLLGGAMWDSLDGEDLPTSIDRLALDSKNYPGYPNGYSAEQKTAMSLSNLHMLLENDYVRLEKVEQTEVAKTGWLARLLGKGK